MRDSRLVLRLGLAGLLSLPLVGCGDESITLAVPTGVVARVTGPFVGRDESDFVVRGAGFRQVTSSEATVTFTAQAGRPFEDGTSATTEVTAVIVSDTEMEGTTPHAVIAGPDAVEARVTVTLPGGLPVDAGEATFLPPTADGIIGSNVFAAAVPAAFTVDGAHFGAAGDAVRLRITAVGLLFGGTTQVTVDGVVESDTRIVATSPLAAVCGSATAAAVLDRITFPDGSTTPSGTSIAIVFEAPRAITIANAAAGSPHADTAAFAASLPEAFALTGSGFGPVGGTALVEFRASIPTFGSSVAVSVEGAIVSATRIEGTSPPGTVCGDPATDLAVTVTLPDGACTASPLAASLLAPTLTSVENVDRGGTEFLAAAPETFRIVGTDFGTTGETVLVRFTADATTPFGGASFTDVVATVVDRTTLEGTSPVAGLFPALPGQPGANDASDTFRLDVTLGGGSCSPTDGPVAATIVGPTIKSLDEAPNAPVDVPSTILLDETAAQSFTIEGSGFGPVGGTATVTFSDATGGTPFDGAPSIAVTAAIVDESTIAGTLPTIGKPRLTTDVPARVAVNLAGGSGAFFNELVTFLAPPTITAVTNRRAPFDQSDPTKSLDTTWLACMATATEIHGTVFDGDVEHRVYDASKGADTPIGAGVLTNPTVSATLITGDSPTDGTVTQSTAVVVRVVNPDGQYDERDDLTWETTGVLPNVNGTKQSGTEAEMHMMVNPKDPRNAAVCCHDASTGFRTVRHVYTKDGGASWTSVPIGRPNSISADGQSNNSFRFDPMNACDAFGNFYVIYGGADGGGPTYVFAHQSRDGGDTFAQVITMPFTPSGGLDRWTAATGPDPAIPGNQVLYVACVDFNSHSGDILVAGVSIAPDGSVAASYPAQIVNDVPRAGSFFYQHGTPSVGPDGELYVSYIRAGNGDTDILIDYDADGLGGTDADLGSSDTVVTSTALGFRVFPTVMPRRGYGVIPMHKVVQTGSKRGRAVIVYTTTGNDNDPAADLDVVTQYSDDFGQTWSDPVLVHSSSSAHQFHPWLDTDPKRGDLYVTWYDSRNDTINNRATQRFAAASKDGASWGSALLLSQGKSNAQTNGSNEYLEYNGVSAVDGCVYACWADNSNFRGENPGGTQVAEQFDVYVSAFMLDPDDS